MKTIYKSFLLILFGCLMAIELFAQVPEPAPPQSQPMALMNATAHLGNGQVIQNAFILIEEGKITQVGDATTARIDLQKYEQVDLSGKHVYPGLILPGTRVGLEDIGAVRATRDHTEVGQFTPNVRSLIAYNTDSEIIATLRYNGILLVESVPGGGTLTGTSSVMALDGWNWEDAAYKKDIAVNLNWPIKKLPPRWWLNETKGRDNPNYKRTVDGLKVFLQEAKSYSQMGTPTTVNLKFEAMKGVFSGEKILHINAQKYHEIIESIQTAESFGIERIVLVGGRDAYYAKDFLKEHDIPVLIDDVHRLPARAEEDVDMPYKLPVLLTEAGIKVGLTYGGLMNSRNLPFYAGTVAGYGLGKEEALKLVTSNTADILGISGSTGTIASGKDANLVVSEGDLLDMRTSKITMALIKGRKLNLDNKQQVLYERFKKKYMKPTAE
ncbi:MAG: amidohydrolase family protein [Bacteroidota bacterium]